MQVPHLILLHFSRFYIQIEKITFNVIEIEFITQCCFNKGYKSFYYFFSILGDDKYVAR